MPDMVPVATQIRAPDPSAGINAYAGILGLQQQKQALQTGAIQQQTASAESQQAQQKNRELQAAQQLVFNGAKSGAYDDGEGGVDRQKLSNDILKVAPVYGEQISGALLSQANEIVANKQAHQNLTVSQKKEMGDTFASLAADPEVDNTKFIDAVEKLRQAHRNDAEFSRMLTSMTTHYPGTASSDQQRALLGRWSAAATGEPQTAPGTIDTGAAIQPVGVNRFGTGFTPAGAPIEKKVPPGAQITTDSFGRPFVVNPQTAAARPVGGGGFTTPVADQPSVMAEIRESRAATANGGVTRRVNQNLFDLADQTRTGPGSHGLQTVAAALGMPSGSRYQEIAAYLDRQAALQAQVMGVPHTNAGMEAASRASGTTEYTPDALKEKVKFFDALNSGAMAYRQGLDKAVGTGATPNLQNYQAFRGSWAKNFDPDIYRAEDAQRRGDQAELAAIKKRLGPNGMKDLAQKSANLRLLEQGQIPP